MNINNYQAADESVEKSLPVLPVSIEDKIALIERYNEIQNFDDDVKDQIKEKGIEKSPIHLGEVHISLVERMNRPGTVRQANVPFSKAVKLFTTVKLAGLKESAKAYSGAVYGDTLYRADKNVIAMSAIILDFDNDVRNKNGTKQCTRNPTYPEDLAGPLNGMCYFFHSTWSNSVDWPKWRVIIPLDRCVDRGQWRSVVDGILWQIGDCSYNIDKSCFEPSRHFLAPSCSSTNESVAFSGYSDGQEVTHVR